MNASAAQKPECPYCGESKGLRVSCDGGLRAFGWQLRPAEYICEDCFFPSDTGPSFEDLPATPSH